ncbi:hypothetical protein HMPREF0239_00030 [Clostridium sp. ATCC BAA-442]|nr:hypothetical protein HMPREF0239_00030 [Clostridium sp. ATCC BAA-442]
MPGQRAHSNQTPPTKARQTGRAFFIPKTEYETQQPAFALFLAGTSHFLPPVVK